MTDELEDARPRFWRAIDDVQRENLIFKEKLRVIEDAFSRHLNFHDGMGRSLESIHAKLETNSNLLVELKSEVSVQSEKFKSMKELPRNFLTFVGLLSGAIYSLYRLWNWIIPTLSIQVPPK